MAGAIAGGAIQTTFAAISFAGAGFLFSKLNHTGYEKEIKRHNRALEKLAKSKELFYENEIRQKNKIAHLRQELSDANADINSTNNSLEFLSQKLMKTRTIEYNGRNFSREPELGDFYKPS